MPLCNSRPINCCDSIFASCDSVETVIAPAILTDTRVSIINNYNTTQQAVYLSTECKGRLKTTVLSSSSRGQVKVETDQGSFNLTQNEPNQSLVAGGFDNPNGPWAILGNPSQTSFYPSRQQGAKIVSPLSTTGYANQGSAVALSADGNVLAIGIPGNDSNYIGATAIYYRIKGQWVAYPNLLIGSDATIDAYQGSAVALSPNGKILAVSGPGDNGNNGAVWIFNLIHNVWTQVGNKIVGTIPGQYFGSSLALSADETTLVVGAPYANGGQVIVYQNIGGVWTLVANLISEDPNVVYQGYAVAISANASTIVVGDPQASNITGCVIVWTKLAGVWTETALLIATDNIGRSDQGESVAISSDGLTIAVGGPNDNGNIGATWIYTYQNGAWQSPTKIIGTGYTMGTYNIVYQGGSMALSANGYTLIVGGYLNNNLQGGIWVFTRGPNNTWQQQGNVLLGTNAIGQAFQATALALSYDGSTLANGAFNDNNGLGAVWVFV